eukprot:PhF_6_TR29275/c0_g1_i2/m.42889
MWKGRAAECYEKLLRFIDANIKPNEAEMMTFHKEMDKKPFQQWTPSPLLESLKAKAKEEGLWNLFLPSESGLTQREYAPMAEKMGRVVWGSEVFNCSAPDTGNMEVLHLYGNSQQKKQWLEPLLQGKIRSAYGMTEPDVASSDATNICCECKRVGDTYVINGKKWWTSGAGDPRAEIIILMCKTGDDSVPIHKRQSMILVPTNTPGVKKVRALSVFGYLDAPHGHLEVHFTNVVVPASNMILGEGRGFEIAQGRLGPGRIHHCMRSIGLAEKGLELLIARAKSRVAFGKPLIQQGVVLEQIAECRIAIDQSRLFVLHAADTIDKKGTKAARKEVAMIKVVVPRMACKVLDEAIQVHGGMGVCQDTELAYLYAQIRTLRLADGPDAVHLLTIGKMEARGKNKL